MKRVVGKFLIFNALNSFFSAARNPATEWNMKSDLQHVINLGYSLNDFDGSGLYEKYIANKYFEDRTLRAMSDAGYIGEKLLEKFLKEIVFQYPEMASQVLVPNESNDRTVGTKWYQRVIKYSLKNKGLGNPSKQCKSNSSIMLTGAHHPRELVSIQMVCYTMLKLLFEYEWAVKNQPSLMETHENSLLDTLSCHDIYFIPVVNLDGYHFISKSWIDTDIFNFVRKNMKIHMEPIMCHIYDLGVDLNRNYGFAFGYDEEGSSSNPCKHNYRGQHPFSEPATRQIRNFLEKTEEGKSVTVALNFHAFGNMALYPFGYMPVEITAQDMIRKTNQELIAMFGDTLCFELIDGELMAHARTNESCMFNHLSGQVQFNFKDTYRWYHKLMSNAKFPAGWKHGNGHKVLSYEANGEASDWMLAFRGIRAMSPELSIQNKLTEDFFIPTPELVNQVLQDHYPWIHYTIMNMMDEDEQIDINQFQDSDPHNPYADPNQNLQYQFPTPTPSPTPYGPYPAPTPSPKQELCPFGNELETGECRLCPQDQEFINGMCQIIYDSYPTPNYDLQDPYPIPTPNYDQQYPSPIKDVTPYEPVTPSPSQDDTICDIKKWGEGWTSVGIPVCSSFNWCQSLSTQLPDDSVCDDGESCGEYVKMSSSNQPLQFQYSCILKKFCGVHGFLTGDKLDGTQYAYFTEFSCPNYDQLKEEEQEPVIEIPKECPEGQVTTGDDCVCPFGQEMRSGSCRWTCFLLQTVAVDGSCVCEDGYELTNYEPGCIEKDIPIVQEEEEFPIREDVLDILDYVDETNEVDEKCYYGQVRIADKCECPQGKEYRDGYCRISRPFAPPPADLYPTEPQNQILDTNTVEIQPYVPEGTINIQPYTPDVIDIYPYTPEALDIQPYVPEDVIYPYVPEALDIQPYVPEDVIYPYVPEALDIQPYIPEDMIYPYVPEALDIQPYVPEDVIYPYVPEALDIQPYVPENVDVQPFVPQGVIIQPYVPEENEKSIPPIVNCQQGQILVDGLCSCPYGLEMRQGYCQWQCYLLQIVGESGACECQDGYDMINYEPGCLKRDDVVETVDEPEYEQPQDEPQYIEPWGLYDQSLNEDRSQERNVQCPEGKEWQDGFCKDIIPSNIVPNEEEPTPIAPEINDYVQPEQYQDDCKNGQVRIGYSCYCPEGYEMVNGTCQPRCMAWQFRSGSGQCSCSSGYVVTNYQPGCIIGKQEVPEVQPVIIKPQVQPPTTILDLCPFGKDLQTGKCQSCPLNQQDINGDCKSKCLMFATYQENGSCKCDDGYEINIRETECVKIEVLAELSKTIMEQPFQCPFGQQYKDGYCRPKCLMYQIYQLDESCKCVEGFDIILTEPGCIKSTDQAKTTDESLQREDSSQINIQCPVGFEYINRKCQMRAPDIYIQPEAEPTQPEEIFVTDCIGGQLRRGNYCYCPPGQELRNDKCQWSCLTSQIVSNSGECTCQPGYDITNYEPGCLQRPQSHKPEIQQPEIPQPSIEWLPTTNMNDCKDLNCIILGLHEDWSDYYGRKKCLYAQIPTAQGTCECQDGYVVVDYEPGCKKQLVSNCPSGQIWQQGYCTCPQGYKKIDEQCVQKCIGLQFYDDNLNCSCHEGQTMLIDQEPGCEDTYLDYNESDYRRQQIDMPDETSNDQSQQSDTYDYDQQPDTYDYNQEPSSYDYNQEPASYDYYQPSSYDYNQQPTSYDNSQDTSSSDHNTGLTVVVDKMYCNNEKDFGNFFGSAEECAEKMKTEQDCANGQGYFWRTDRDGDCGCCRDGSDALTDTTPYYLSQIWQWQDHSVSDNDVTNENVEESSDQDSLSYDYNQQPTSYDSSQDTPSYNSKMGVTVVAQQMYCNNEKDFGNFFGSAEECAEQMKTDQDCVNGQGYFWRTDKDGDCGCCRDGSDALIDTTSYRYSQIWKDHSITTSYDYDSSPSSYDPYALPISNYESLPPVDPYQTPTNLFQSPSSQNEGYSDPNQEESPQQQYSTPYGIPDTPFNIPYSNQNQKESPQLNVQYGLGMGNGYLVSSASCDPKSQIISSTGECLSCPQYQRPSANGKVCMVVLCGDQEFLDENGSCSLCEHGKVQGPDGKSCIMP